MLEVEVFAANAFADELFPLIQVLAMVEEETRRYRPTKNYLEHLPPLKLHEFETDILRAELERLQARTPMDMISMKRLDPMRIRVRE